MHKDWMELGVICDPRALVRCRTTLSQENEIATAIQQLSTYVEMAALSCWHEGKTGEHTLQAAPVDNLQLLQSKKVLDQELLKHALAGSEHSRPFRNLVLATDKGQVNGLGLQDTALLAPDNVAWICAPMAPGPAPKGQPQSLTQSTQPRASSRPEIRSKSGRIFFPKMKIQDLAYKIPQKPMLHPVFLLD